MDFLSSVSNTILKAKQYKVVAHIRGKQFNSNQIHHRKVEVQILKDIRMLKIKLINQTL